MLLDRPFKVIVYEVRKMYDQQQLIRLINDDELLVALDVIRRSFQTVAMDFGITKENCPTNAAFLARDRLIQEKESGSLLFGLFLCDKMVGFIELYLHEDQSLELQKLAVLPKYRHRGFGKELISHAKKEAELCHKNVIKIGIINENTTLKQWYLSNGFIQTELRRFNHLPFTVCFMEFYVR